MTFLELVEKLRKRTDSGGGVLSDVENLTGPPGRLVIYIAEAWREIQASRRDWSFRTGEFSISLTAGAAEYDLYAAINGGEIRTLSGVYVITPVSQPNSKRRVPLLTYHYFQNLYATRALPSGMPTEFCILPDDRTARFGVLLNEDANFAGPYYKAAQALTAKSDVPNLPAEYHDAIFWLGLKKWAAYEEAAEVLREAKIETDTWKTTLVNEFAPRLLVGSKPLA